MYCCFTGHRPAQLPWGRKEDRQDCIKAKKTIEMLVKQSIVDGYTDFYCGMALGADTYFAEAVLKMKEQGSDVRLHAAIPCPQQNEGWSSQNNCRYNKILEKCATKTIVSPVYTRTCMLSRNRFMVENSQRVIALWNGDFSGGTGYTVRYAQAEKREIYIIRLPELSVSVIS